MTHSINTDIETWEAVATAAVLQAANTTDVKVGGSVGLEARELLRLGLSDGDGDCQTFKYAEAYRKLEAIKDIGYPELLASENGLEYASRPVQWWPGLDTSRAGHIVMAPFGIKRELDLPMQGWQAVFRLLTTYQKPVYLIGDYPQRADACPFYENEILCQRTVEDKICALAGAALIVGVPNAWTWAAVGMKTPMIILYPDNQPGRRWFPWAEEHIGRILTDSRGLQVPILLSALRKLIQIL